MRSLHRLVMDLRAAFATRRKTYRQVDPNAVLIILTLQNKLNAPNIFTHRMKKTFKLRCLVM